MRSASNAVVWIGGLVVGLLVGVVDLALRVVAIVFALLVIAFDLFKASKTKRGNQLVCPRGHAFDIEDITLECEACGFTYEGSALRCPYPECEAPSAPYVDCAVCGLSVRNPYRWGRP